MFAPKPRKTASYFCSNSCNSKFFPSSLLYCTSIPKLKIASIVLSKISLSSLNSGIPCINIPPSLLYFSKIVTSAPLLAKKLAQFRPDGPPPTTAIFLPTNSCVFSIFLYHPFFNASSNTYASIAPICTGSPFTPLTQLP